MARRQPSKLTSHYKLPPSPQLTRYLLRLSKPSLEKLVFDWLKTPVCAPDLSPTNDDLLDAAYDEEPQDTTLEEVEEAYTNLASRKEIIERVFEREWRSGLTMHQIAQVDMQYLLDHPSSLKWTASELVLEEGKKPAGDKLPKFQPVVFCKSIQEIMDPMVQCHPYYITHPTLPLTILRLSLHNPYPLPTLPPPANQIFYLAVPISSPHLFFTPQRSKLADICRKSLPIALSSQHRRYDIVSTALTAKTLEALLARKGCERGDLGAGGGWSVFAVEGEGAFEGDPLETSRPRKRQSLDANMDEYNNGEGKKRKRIAEERFGKSATVGDGSGLERVEVKLREVWPRGNEIPGVLGVVDGNAGKSKKGRPKKDVAPNTNDEDSPLVDEHAPWKGKSWMPNVDVVLEGTHVFAGVRTLVEEGVFDGEKIPTWMTGEEGKSVGMVKGGTILKSAVAAGILEATTDTRRDRRKTT
ncbi:hypothetical protein EYR41_012026 [Orbilia oligospora]|uniref:CHL4-domain-containing protein n=1 Tax=Orbilia oligospora TaxID=2813651 RepID=A0A8H2DLV5_ORBOL|nr:hypothetical protein EYR41_012026 [Orbilia oligospora]